MFSLTKCVLVCILCMGFRLASSVPLASQKLGKRIVFDPPVTKPSKGTVWTVGQKQTVTWDTSVLPEDSKAAKPTGNLILGYILDGQVNLHLDIDNPLAENVQLWDGKAEVTVPKVKARSTYIVVLMGSSGNKSAQFTIKAGGAAGGAAQGPDTTSLITDPIPITGTTITGGITTKTSSVDPTGTGSDAPTTTVESSSTPTVTSSTVGSSSATLTSISAISTLPSASAAASTSAPNAGMYHGPAFIRTACLTMFSALLVIVL
ncbi:hypothetical protein DL96DRAFT_1612175 [Flagelloscypha sp. PMI_526]|nr:hypothetical protein DL96DRAFT_1612175 [Flagelloscypha sp. PMI_526]